MQVFSLKQHKQIIIYQISLQLSKNTVISSLDCNLVGYKSESKNPLLAVQAKSNNKTDTFDNVMKYCYA